MDGDGGDGAKVRDDQADIMARRGQVLGKQRATMGKVMVAEDKDGTTVTGSDLTDHVIMGEFNQIK
jgi:hypothetical protein